MDKKRNRETIRFFSITMLVLTMILTLTTGRIFALSGALSGREIMEKVKETTSPKTAHSAIELIIVEKSGIEKKRTLEMWTIKDSHGLNRSLIIFRQPASVKNTRFLIIQNKNKSDDQYIYLPALRRVRRIAASARNKSFMGTEFSYEDMSTRDIDDDTHKLLREERYNGYDCYVVESIPKNMDNYHYSKTIHWIAQKMWVVMKIEMYDTKGKLKKILTLENFKKINGYWNPQKTIMKNVQTGRATLLKNLKTEYDKKFPETLFSVQYLKRGKLN